MAFLDPAHVDVLAPNFKRRQSGVTATVVRSVPMLARDIAIAAVAPSLPDLVPQIRLRDLLLMSRRGPSGPRVWHARRNSEMLVGLILRRLLQKDLKLLFTSASQRHHTRYSRWLIRQMDYVISTSHQSAGYLDRSSTVIPHGIDLEGFAPPRDRAVQKRHMGLPEGPVVGCFGRIRAGKGTGDFVEAMLTALPAVPGTVAIIMGRATPKHWTYKRKLQNRIRSAGLQDRIHFLPEVPSHKIADWYKAIDLLVAPQRWEGFGLTPLEAMACGVPVVATRVGTFQDQVIDGKTGRLIPPRDVSAMADAIRAYMENSADRASQGKAARAHVEMAFDINHEIAGISAVYRELLGADGVNSNASRARSSTSVSKVQT